MVLRGNSFMIFGFLRKLFGVVFLLELNLWVYCFIFRVLEVEVGLGGFCFIDISKFLGSICEDLVRCVINVV